MNRDGTPSALDAAADAAEGRLRTLAEHVTFALGTPWQAHRIAAAILAAAWDERAGAVSDARCEEALRALRGERP